MAPGGEGPRCQEKRISRMSDMVTENRSLEVTSDFSESSFYGVLGAGGLSRKEGKSEYKYHFRGICGKADWEKYGS